MTEELEQLLKNLKLKRMAAIYDEQLRGAEQEQVSYSEFLTRLMRAQYHARQEGALECASGAPICPKVGHWRRFRLPASPA